MDNSLHWLETVIHTDLGPTVSIKSETDNPVFDTEHHAQLMTLKSEIDLVQPVQTWDTAKKITNPYEYIFLSLQKRTHRSIAAIIPLSRSYFKMVEMWELLQFALPPGDLMTSHSAEGPGGFLEAILDRIRPKHARMVAMTLRSTERTIPGWRKSQQFLTTYPNVLVTYGEDGTGNLYSLKNQDAFAKATNDHLGPGLAHLYTADGGFDFSADFNGQETAVQRLLAAEALSGLLTLAPGGTMILKLFDTKHAGTLDLMWILSGCFEKTALTKPLTSRPANSERYWIGSGLRASIPTWVVAVLKTLTSTDAPNGWSQIFESRPYTETWLTPIRLFQSSVEEQQIHNIQLTLNLIKQPTRKLIYDLLLANVKNSRTWCNAHGIPINRQYVGITDEQVTVSNLEEALEPFQALVSRTSSLASSPHLPTHRVSTSSPSLLPPAGPAWRTALPASILGRESSKTTSGTAPSSDSEKPQSLPEESTSHEEH